MARKKQKPPPPAKPLKLKWQRQGQAFEAFNYPSSLAREVFLYVRSIGHAKHPPSFQKTGEGQDGFLIHFFKRGQLWHRIRERIHVARAGDAVLMDYSEDLVYGNKGPGTAEFYWVLFNGRTMPRLFQEFLADREPLFTPVDAARVEEVFRELMVVATKKPAAFEIKASALLTMILAELFASRQPMASFVSHAVEGRHLSEAVRKGIDVIARFYDGILPAKHIAAAVGQSLPYFSSQFHAQVGMTPMDFLNRYRVEESKRLLETTDKSMAQIAHSTGFPDQNYYARTFTRITGMPPSEHRSQSQKETETKKRP